MACYLTKKTQAITFVNYSPSLKIAFYFVVIRRVTASIAIYILGHASIHYLLAAD